VAPTQAQLADYLAELIKTRRLACYSEVNEYFCIQQPVFPWRNNPLASLFAKIDQEDIIKDKPLRNSVVVRKSKAKNKVPSDGYFKRLCDYRNQPLPQTLSEKRDLHYHELKKLNPLWEW
jgi:hypothetical protein